MLTTVVRKKAARPDLAEILATDLRLANSRFMRLA